MKNGRNSFTLVELLASIIIIAVITTVATGFYLDYVKRAKVAKAKSDLGIIARALMIYQMEEDLDIEKDANLKYLLMGKFLNFLPLDPWGREYKINPLCGYVYSEGETITSKDDDIKVYYQPCLILKRALYIDRNSNGKIDNGDVLKLIFTKYIDGNGKIPKVTTDKTDNEADLLFSKDVDVSKLSPIDLMATATYCLINITGDAPFTIGKSTVTVTENNDVFFDCEGFKVLTSTKNQDFAVVIKKPSDL